MNTKLTLNLDKAVIAQAKNYAKGNGTSLSKLIENYLNTLTSIERTSGSKISPLVESLTGVIPDLGADDHDKKAYLDYLTKKYS